MREIQITARCQIKPGKLEAFKTAARACLRSVREKDPGTLQYDWFFSADQTECVVRETYRDSAAVVAHAENLGEALVALVAACDLSLEIYGDVSPELVAAAADLPHRIYRQFQGL